MSIPLGLILRIGLKVLSNSSLKGSILEVIQGIATHLIARANDPQAIRNFGQMLQDKAPILVGAILSGTDAASKPDRVPLVEQATRELNEARGGK